MVTVEEIKAKVSSNPRWAERAILVIYEYQTREEQVVGETQENNGVGFNGVDAFILSSFATQIATGRTLSPKQLAIAYRKLPKYAGQLVKVAEAKASAA